MSFKILQKQKAAYFCDVCNKEIDITDAFHIVKSDFFNNREFLLCGKHGKLIEKQIKDLKVLGE